MGNQMDGERSGFMNLTQQQSVVFRLHSFDRAIIVNDERMERS